MPRPQNDFGTCAVAEPTLECRNPFRRFIRNLKNEALLRLGHADPNCAGTKWFRHVVANRHFGIAIGTSWQSHPLYQLYKSGILPQIVEIWIDLQVQHFT